MTGRAAGQLVVVIMMAVSRPEWLRRSGRERLNVLEASTWRCSFIVAVSMSESPRIAGARLAIQMEGVRADDASTPRHATAERPPRLTRPEQIAQQENGTVHRQPRQGQLDQPGDCVAPELLRLHGVVRSRKQRSHLLPPRLNHVTNGQARNVRSGHGDQIFPGISANRWNRALFRRRLQASAVLLDRRWRLRRSTSRTEEGRRPTHDPASVRAFPRDAAGCFGS